LPSQWTMNESEPASTNSSKKKSGSVIIKCVSRGRCVTLRSDLTMGAPMERLGTKWPSITSTWMRSAAARSAWATCSPNRAKSAARIDGAILMALFCIVSGHQLSPFTLHGGGLEDALNRLIQPGVKLGLGLLGRQPCDQRPREARHDSV